MTKVMSSATPQAKKHAIDNATVGNHLHAAQERATTIVPTAGPRNESLADCKAAVGVVVVGDVAYRPERGGAERKHNEAQNDGHDRPGPAMAGCVHFFTVMHDRGCGTSSIDSSRR